MLKLKLIGNVEERLSSGDAEVVVLVNAPESHPGKATELPHVYAELKLTIMEPQFIGKFRPWKKAVLTLHIEED